MTDSVLTQQLGPGQRGSRRDCVVQRMVNTGRFPQVVEPPGDCIQVVVEMIRLEIKGSWPRTHV